MKLIQFFGILGSMLNYTSALELIAAYIKIYLQDQASVRKVETNRWVHHFL